MASRDDTEIFDVLILGAGPAGSTAAAALAKAGRTVCLIDAAQFPAQSASLGWISAQCVPILEETGVTLKDLGAHEIKTVAFCDASLSKTAHPMLEAPVGYVVDRATLAHRLVRNAAVIGADVRQKTRVVDVVLEERQVTLRVRDPGVAGLHGKLLVLAAGRGTPLLRRVGVLMDMAHGGSWAAQVESVDPAHKGVAAVYVILGIDPAGGFGFVLVSRQYASVGVQTTADRKDVIPLLVTICRRATERGLLTPRAGNDLARQAAKAGVTVTPTAVALSLDTHVGKRTLVVGDAGGFVAAASGEGIYPSMWSARIAADVILKALDAPSPQDVLMEFDTAWRTKMADYLRAPNTDAQYILPLVFSSQPMADRMAAAFFGGENI